MRPAARGFDPLMWGWWAAMVVIGAVLIGAVMSLLSGCTPAASRAHGAAMLIANALVIGAVLAGHVFRARKMWRAAKVTIGLILLAVAGLLLVACTVEGSPCTPESDGCPTGWTCRAGKCSHPREIRGSEGQRVEQEPQRAVDGGGR